MSLQLWRDGIPIIDDDTPVDYLFNEHGRGAVPRDFNVQPQEMFAAPDSIKAMSQSELEAYIKAADEQQSSLEHIYLRAGWPHLVQGQWGYCWTHSVTHAVMLERQAANLPYVPLSAFAVAATIKRGLNQGGWCGLAMQFARERGIPSQQYWPQGTADYRRYDKPEVWENAALHKVTEDIVDLTRPVYAQNLTLELTLTMLALNRPCAVDFNWWGHSVCGVRPVIVEAGSIGMLILNSWPGWGRQGLGVLRGSRMRPDGAVCVMSTVPSVN